MKKTNQLIKIAGQEPTTNLFSEGYRDASKVIMGPIKNLARKVVDAVYTVTEGLSYAYNIGKRDQAYAELRRQLRD